MEDAQKLIILAVVVAVLGILAAIVVAYKNNYMNFITRAHIWSLLLLLVAGGLTWMSMVWITHPTRFRVTKKQWVSLVMSLLIAVLWFMRYAYVIADKH